MRVCVRARVLDGCALLLLAALPDRACGVAGARRSRALDEADPQVWISPACCEGEIGWLCERVLPACHCLVLEIGARVARNVDALPFSGFLQPGLMGRCCCERCSARARLCRRAAERTLAHVSHTHEGALEERWG